MAYSAKYASGFYGPFRDAVGSAASLGKGNKFTYQMDPPIATRRFGSGLDFQEGADMVMGEAGMPISTSFAASRTSSKRPPTSIRSAASTRMLKAAFKNGWLPRSSA